MAKSPELQFRAATPDDAGAIQQLIQTAFRADDSRADWTADTALNRSFSISVEEVLPIIVDSDSDFLIASGGAGDNNNNTDPLIAVIGVKKTPDGAMSRLIMLSVDPNHHRGGYGRQALLAGQEYSQRVYGVKKLGLNALNTRPQLLAWYERFGFRRTGETTPFPVAKKGDRGADMEELFFVEMEKDL